MTEYAIDIANVTKRYAEHTAVRDLTLRVPTGSVYGLLGPNGAGKTTTIRTLLHDPDLVILDEPFSGLDPINAQALKDTVVELKRRGKTVIFSTHLMDNAERLCDSVCIIARGEKVLDGVVTDVKEEHGQRNI